ncbi:MAG TPA: class I tRNA ligase family protein, partial [Anaerolineales bacterium]|nr:class I tRNA ligase family protein [Anaerolineales bacterium]
LWPFSTLGWPEETPDYKYFYPTSYMETGYDILFFWVARMIMSGLEYTGKIPFHTVYLHGTIRDEFGRRMSKTYGNGIDPLIVMDEYGTDALRFTLLVGSTPGNDMNLSIGKVAANRNFANKLWNVGRFVITAIDSLPSAPLPEGEGVRRTGEGDYTLADSWIWSKLQQLVRDVERQFQNFQYGQAGQQIYDFIWNDFADWYVEIAKEQLKNDETNGRTVETLARVFDMSLRLLHPFTPFVTEEIWGHLHSALRESSLNDICKDWPDALIVAKWPEERKPEGWEEKILQDFAKEQEIIRSIRNARAENNVKPSLKFQPVFVASEDFDLLQRDAHFIAGLTGTYPPQIFRELDSKPENHIGLVSGTTAIYLPLAGMVDLANDKARLDKELKEAESHIQRLENLLNGEFADKAPAALVQKEREKLAGYKDTAEKIKPQLK